ncbi:helix-turn-helix transcriptional regulator [Proteus columbae]|uniref:helix-turn-helix transcriptional regulator n=1 Tax=Proteus columbae TaxID=1987580 RepID=UPI000C1E5C52|nr:helix-turn-helix transcriptional regulator [Proteus columbae]
MKDYYFHLKNLTLSNYIMILTKDSEIQIKTNNTKKFIDKNSIILISKDTKFDVYFSNTKKPILLYLSCDVLRDALKINLISNKFKLKENTNNIENNILIKKAQPEDILLFNKLKINFNNEIITSDKIEHSQILELAYLLVGLEINIMSFLYKIYNSSYTEKITNIISEDLSYGWTIKDISKKLYIGTSSLRKKLETEKTSFTKILTKTRMEHAINLLTTTNLNINTISNKLGYKTTSYFIKKFKEYYKSTPKKMLKNYKTGIK